MVGEGERIERKGREGERLRSVWRKIKRAAADFDLELRIR